MDEASLTILMMDDVRLRQHDDETRASLRALAESLADLWRVDVAGIPPAVGFDPGAGWDDGNCPRPDAPGAAGEAWRGL